MSIQFNEQEFVQDLTKAARSLEGKIPVKVKVIPKKGRIHWRTIMMNIKDIKEGIFGKLKEWFGTTDARELNDISNNEYKKHDIAQKKNVDKKTWGTHFFEYWGDKRKWDGAFTRKKGALELVEKKKKEKKMRVVKKKGKISKLLPKTLKFNIGLMRTISGLYKYKKYAPSLDAGLKIRDEGEPLPDPPGVRGKKKGQPYKADGIILGRSKQTKFASKEYLSDDLNQKLRTHQKDFVNLAMQNFINGNKSVANFDGTGSGKTIQQLALADTYVKKSKKPVLITTENIDIFENAFKGDADKLGLKVKYITDPREMTEPGIYVTVYSALHKLKPIFNDFGLSIFDESHNMKNATSKTGRVSAKSKMGIELLNSTDNVAMFSATPLDKPGHIKYMCEAFDLDYSRVMKYLAYKQVKSKKTGKMINQRISSAKEVSNKLESIFDALTEKGLAVKREVSLDNVDINIPQVVMTQKSKAKYNKAYKTFSKKVDDMIAKGANGLEKAKGLLTLRRIAEEAKIDHAVNSIEQGIKDGKQIVLFATSVNDSGASKDLGVSYTKSTIQEISRRLEKKGIPFSTVFGETSSRDKNMAINQFQAGDIPVIITTPKSGGTGINLDDIEGNKPRKAIIMSPPFSAMDVIQMMGRINRLNTKSRAEVDILTSDTSVDRWNKDIIANKLHSLGGAVQGDYSKLDLEETELLGGMSEKQAEEYLKQKAASKTSAGIKNKKFKFNWKNHKKRYVAGEAETALAKATIIDGRYVMEKFELEKFRRIRKAKDSVMDDIVASESIEENDDELRLAEEIFIEAMQNGEMGASDEDTPRTYPKILEDM